jgi:hypothetical protein
MAIEESHQLQSAFVDLKTEKQMSASEYALTYSAPVVAAAASVTHDGMSQRPCRWVSPLPLLLLHRLH